MKTKNRLISNFRSRFSSFLIKNRRPIVGGVLFIIGSLFGFGFNSLAVIADLNGAGFWGDNRDAMKFDHDQPTQAELVQIRCPILLAPLEEGTITATFRNPNQATAAILVKAVVSERNYNNYRVVTGSLPIEARDEQSFRWQITSQDIIQGNFTLTRVFLMNDEIPARTESCGIFTLSFFGMKGAPMVVLMLGISLISLGVGSVLFYPRNAEHRELTPRIEYGLHLLAAILLIGMVDNLLGWWIFAGLVLVLAVLLTIVLIPSMFHLSV